MMARGAVGADQEFALKMGAERMLPSKKSATGHKLEIIEMSVNAKSLHVAETGNLVRAGAAWQLRNRVEIGLRPRHAFG